MKQLLLLTSFVGAVLAQTAPPPYPLPNLPPGFSQKTIISGTKLCPGSGSGSACYQFAGSNWEFASKGGSGGVSYDSSGNLLFGASNHSNPAPLLSIQKMTPDGKVTALLSFGTAPLSCVQTSPTSLTEFFPNINITFSVNPIFNTLYLTTVNRAVDFAWNATTTTGSCVGDSYSINGPYTIVDNLFTYATIVLTGSDI